jgi:hypothetical protein
MLRLHEDTRIPGRVDYVLSAADRLMQIPDEIRKCVGFVGYRTPDGVPSFFGTFYLVYTSPGPNYNCAYGVTAAHVINGMHAAGIPAPMLRVNPMDGSSARWITTRYEDWYIADDPTHDTAIVLLPLGTTEFDYVSLSVEMAVTPGIISQQQIGPGNDVFVTGLFLMFADPRMVYGVDRNIPIVRSGHIAAMRGELVPSKLGKVDAYLIEARSIGGLSGSPVFVHLGSVRVREGKVQTAASDSGVFFLLGHVHGHFPVHAAEPLPSAAGMNEDDVNMGIALVIPADLVTGLLDREDVLAARMEEYGRALAAQTVTPDVQPSEP